METDLRINEQEFSFGELLSIKEHMKQYNNSKEKKEFLKNITPYEQKQILLDSHDPYEVLTFLSEINSKQANIVFSSLDYQEIHLILERFSLENKKEFYTKFPNLDLVNKFIKYDQGVEEYIVGLTTDRKIELLESAKIDTVAATSKIIECTSEQEQQIIIKNVTSVDGRYALNQANYNVNLETDVYSEEVSLQADEDDLFDKVNETELEEDEKRQGEKEEQSDMKQLLDFLKSNIDNFKLVKGLENLNLDDPNFYSSLSEELKEYINQEFSKQIESKEPEKESNSTIADNEAQQEVQDQSAVEISSIGQEAQLNSFQEAQRQAENEIVRECQEIMMEETQQKTL